MVVGVAGALSDTGMAFAPEPEAGVRQRGRRQEEREGPELSSAARARILLSVAFSIDKAS
jgi:hypothetical protein